MSGEEEMVPVSLGDDYYQGAYFLTKDNGGAPLHYLVPRSQLERWQEAMDAYGAMQDEISTVMDEQRERIRAINAQRPKTVMGSIVEQIYSKQMEFALRATPLPPAFRGPDYGEPK